MSVERPDQEFTLRCATVYVAEGEDTLIYRSLDEMPPRVRRRVLSGSHSAGVATIFIANRGGREELARRLRGLPSRIKTRVEASVDTPPVAVPKIEPPSFASFADEGRIRPIVRHAVLLAAGFGLLTVLLTWNS